MNSVLIYYTAHKTGYCETALKSVISPMGINIYNIIAAVSPSHLGESINNSLNECSTVFIIGDINRKDKSGLMPVLSCGLCNNNVNSSRLQAENSKGYLLELNEKKLIVLPDEPDKIGSLVTARLIDYLKMRK